MMRLIPLIPAAIVLFVASPVSAQEWVEYISQQDSFSINFPTEPEIRDVKYKSEYGVELPSRVYRSVDQVRRSRGGLSTCGRYTREAQELNTEYTNCAAILPK